jgi:hypothetical protein
VFSCGGNRVFLSYFLKNETLDKPTIYQDMYSCGIYIPVIPSYLHLVSTYHR